MQLPLETEVWMKFSDSLIIGKISGYEYFDGRLRRYEIIDRNGNKIWVLPDAVRLWEF